MTSEMERQMNNAARLRAQNKLNDHLHKQFGPAVSPEEAVKKIQAGVKAMIIRVKTAKAASEAVEPLSPPIPPEPRYRRVILPRTEDLDEPVLC